MKLPHLTTNTSLKSAINLYLTNIMLTQHRRESFILPYTNSTSFGIFDRTSSGTVGLLIDDLIDSNSLTFSKTSIVTVFGDGHYPVYFGTWYRAPGSIAFLKNYQPCRYLVRQSISTSNFLPGVSSLISLFKTT